MAFKSSIVLTSWPSALIIISPVLKPALSAGEYSSIERIYAPFTKLEFGFFLIISSVISLPVIPI